MEKAIYTKYNKLFLILLLLFQVTGCIRYREPDNFLKIYPWPPTSIAGVEELEIVIHAKSIVNGTESSDAKSLDDLKERIRKTCEEAGLRIVKFDEQASRVKRVEITVTSRRQYNKIMSIVAPVTLYIMPSVDKNELSVEMTVTDSSGSRIGSFSASDTITTLKEVYLLPVMIFNLSDNTMDKAINEVTRAVIHDAARNGAL